MDSKKELIEALGKVVVKVRQSLTKAYPITMQSDTILNSFIETVVPEIRKYFNPSKILIFGSRVSGEATENSDIDVIIVSDFFRGIKFVKRMADVLRKIKFSRHIDFICYTPEEFEKIQESSTVVKAALLEGIFA